MKTFRDKFYAWFLILLVIPGTALTETMYKSVGPDGRVSYSDSAPANGTVEKTLTFTNLPATPLPASVIRYRQELQKSLQNRLSSSAKSRESREGVQLFAAAWCGYCRKAKSYLAEKNIAYHEYDIDTPDGQLAFAQIGTGSGIPLLLWQGKQTRGFSREGYDRLFGRSK